MTELINKIDAIIADYAVQLKEQGVVCSVSKRYVEANIHERTGSLNSPLLDGLDRYLDKKREKANGWHNQRNRFHFAVLTFSPTERQRVPKAECKKYAFLLRYRGRVHIGEAPKEISRPEDRVLRRVERRIQKMLRMADRCSGAEVCRDGFLDGLRYVLSAGYEDKKKILGKDRWVWELSVMVAAVLLAVLTIVLLEQFLCK